TEGLLENVVQIKVISLPLGNCAADLQRNGTFLPDILDTGTNDLLRVDVQHLGLKIRVVGFHTEISETVEAPSSAARRSIGEGLRFVEIHQKRCVGESVEPDVDQRFLVLECGHVRTPAFAPIAHRRNVDAVEIWISVISFAGFGY